MVFSMSKGKIIPNYLIIKLKSLIVSILHFIDNRLSWEKHIGYVSTKFSLFYLHIVTANTIISIMLQIEMHFTSGIFTRKWFINCYLYAIAKVCFISSYVSVMLCFRSRHNFKMIITIFFILSQ